MEGQAPAVSIPVWVFSPSRLSDTKIRLPEGLVSIPVWVFSPSRQIEQRDQSAAGNCFNPGLGFQSVATTSKKSPLAALMFQSRSGFSVRRDLTIEYIQRAPVVFQSRSGFSVRRDVALGSFVRSLVDLFQSRSGFSVRRDIIVCNVDLHTCPFQSRSGFSVRRDPLPGFVGDRRAAFQSRSGFSVRRDDAVNKVLNGAELVSIPVWVFSPSRQLPCSLECFAGGVSIPVWVFSPSRQEGGPERSNTTM